MGQLKQKSFVESHWKLIILHSFRLSLTGKGASAEDGCINVDEHFPASRN